MDRKIELEEKSLVIELKRNKQGHYVRMSEFPKGGSRSRGRITMSTEKAMELRSLLNEFLAEYERLPEEESVTGSKTLKTYVFVLYCLFFVIGSGY